MLEVVRIGMHSHIREITCKVAILSLFGSFAHKVVQTWSVLHETWHTTRFGIYYRVEVVII